MNNGLLLTGANGRTGRAVLGHLARSGIRVRALIRNAAQAEALTALGAAECIVGDLADRESLDRAIAGVGKLLHIGPPMHPEEFTFTRRLVDFASGRGIGHFIYYSVLHPHLREIRHHRLKQEAEEHILQAGLPFTIVQPSRYMQHLETIWAQVVAEGIHPMPFSVDQRFSVVDLDDVAEACAVISLSEAFLYGVYELAGPEPLSQRDMAAIIAEVIGRPVEARAVPLEQMRAQALARGASEDRVAQMETMNRHYDAHGLRSNSKVLEAVLGRPATRFRHYVERRSSFGGGKA